MDRSKQPAIEKEYGKPLCDLLPELMEQYGSVSAIAKALNVSQPTVSQWIRYCGLKIKTIIVPEEREVEPA